MESDAETLARDVSFDVHKAKVKLRRLREQLQRDRGHAERRMALMTTAEAKLAAAIDKATNGAEKGPDSRSKDKFDEAMRQRIRGVAALRALSADEIKSVPTLKLYAIVAFCERHSVNVEWLFEGHGPIFTKGN